MAVDTNTITIYTTTMVPAIYTVAWIVHFILTIIPGIAFNTFTGIFVYAIHASAAIFASVRGASINILACISFIAGITVTNIINTSSMNSTAYFIT